MIVIEDFLCFVIVVLPDSEVNAIRIALFSVNVILIDLSILGWHDLKSPNSGMKSESLFLSFNVNQAL